MKKMAAKCMIFSLMILALCAGTLALSMREPFRPAIARLTNSEDFMDESEMLPYFERAGQQDRTTRLIVGDSICRQLFSPLGEYDPDTSILATNAALMMPGQYLLTRKYLESHPETTDVFLIMHPLTLTRTFDMEWGYRYAAMTYVETDSWQYLDEGTQEILRDTYGRFFLRKDTVWLIEKSPICRKLGLNHLYAHGTAYAQSQPFEIADRYVQELYDLCQERGVRLHLYSSPVTESYREEMETLAQSYGETRMSGLFPDYMRDIWYYPQDWTEDLSHFSGEYAGRDKLNEIIEQAYGDTPLGESIHLRER